MILDERGQTREFSKGGLVRPLDFNGNQAVLQFNDIVDFGAILGPEVA
jgi:hypothetical protein